jgi:hypothetical protein
LRKLLLAGLVAGSLVAGAGIAQADSRSGSSESDTYDCELRDADGNVTQPQTGPGPDSDDDCTGGSTYVVHDNDVDCTDESTVPAQQGIGISVNGEPSQDGWFEAESCNDQSTGPIQGRAIVGGSFEEGGVHATADGDKDNPEQAQGWATVAVTTEGPSVTCGNDADNLDSTESSGTQADCPAPVGEG